MLSTNILMLILTIVLATHGRHQHRSHRKSHQLTKILKLSDNLFRDISKTTKKVMNGIFESLNLSKQFSKEQKIKLLLTMHSDLNDIAEKNFQLYDVLRNASALDFDNKPINQIRLNDLIIGILNEKGLNTRNESTNNENSKNIQHTSRDKSYKPEFANSKEFKEFISAFIGKLRRLTVDDLFNKKESLSSSEWEESGRRNLEVWEPSRENTGTHHMENRRIYGGQQTDIFSYPFIVSIHIQGEFICAGSIISKHLIITAASCLQVHYNKRFFVENPKNTFARLGSDWTSWRGELVPVLEIYFYPEYDPKTLNHNLAIMRLLRNLKLPTHRKITRVLLDRGDRNLHSNSTVIKILGWGAMQPNQIINQYEKLNYAVLNTYHIQECQEIYSKAYVTENHFCAGFKTKKTGACNRDVGGPGMIGNFLVGVISFGASVCGSPNAPTVFTRIGYYIDWIDHIMALHPKRYGIVTAGPGGKKLLIYYKRPLADPYPFKHPIKALRGSTSPVLRAQDTQENQDETIILHNMTNNKDRTMLDEMHHDVYDDVVDIFKPEPAEQNLSKHPLIKFLLPGVHYSLPGIKITTPSTTTLKVIPTFMLRSTPFIILRTRKEPNQYNVSTAAISEKPRIQI